MNITNKKGLNSQPEDVIENLKKQIEILELKNSELEQKGTHLKNKYKALKVKIYYILDKTFRN